MCRATSLRRNLFPVCAQRQVHTQARSPDRLFPFGFCQNLHLNRLSGFRAFVLFMESLTKRDVMSIEPDFIHYEGKGEFCSSGEKL